MSPVGAVACTEHASAQPDTRWAPLDSWHLHELEEFAGRQIGCEACVPPRPKKPRRLLPLWLQPHPQMP